MKKNDAQLGFPSVLYKDTKANIEALTGVAGGAVAYATDTGEGGFYNELFGTWLWSSFRVLLVVNKTGATLTENTSVYINGAQGNRPTVAKTKADAEATSHGVLAFVFADIANNAEGLVITDGIKDGFDTSGFTAGDTLYQSAATAGAVTNVAPTAPNHSTVMGYALNSTVNGRILVRPQSGFELSELHDVLISGISDEQLLAYDNATGLWKNKTLLTSAQATDLTDGGATTLHTHAAIPSDGWNSVSWASPTRTSASVFTVAGDVTGIIQKGYKLKYTDTTTKYAPVKSVTFGVGVSTITIFVNTDYTIVGNPSAISWSNVENPYGWPNVFTYTPTFNNLTIGNGTLYGKMQVSGVRVYERAGFIFGSTTSITGGGAILNLVPIATPLALGTAQEYFGAATIRDFGTALYDGTIYLIGGNLYPQVGATAGAYSMPTNITATVPMTWITGDEISMICNYVF